MTTHNFSGSLGFYLRQRRNELKLSQTAIAGETGISPSYYSSIEKNRQIPPSNTLTRIIQALGFGEEKALELKELAAVGRGLAPDDAELSEEIQALIADIRKAANTMPPRFIKSLRTKVREVLR